MIDPAYVALMARYNRWQNRSLLAAGSALSDDQRREDRGAFFGSIHNTLTHLIWADQAWLARFTGRPAPWLDHGSQAWPRSPRESVGLALDWADLVGKRTTLDEMIIDWASQVEPAWLASDLTWTNSAGRSNRQPVALLVTHFFNHQTHHRGQVHALLTSLGARPEDTDLPWMPDA